MIIAVAGVGGHESSMVSPELPALARAAKSVTPTIQANGNFARIVNAGRVIGVARRTGQAASQATSTYTVITNAVGELVTVFPGTPTP